jgi:hypothetical protein
MDFFFFAGKPERKRLFWRPTCARQDNIKINLKEIRLNGFDCTSLQLHQLYALFYLLRTVPSVLAFSTQVRGFKHGRSRRIFKGEKVLSTPFFGGEASRRSHVVDLRHVKDPYMAWKSSFGKITGQHSRPQFHLPPLRSRVVADVGAPGGESWNV